MTGRQVAFLLAGLLGAAGVVAGAFTAHGLDSLLEARQLDAELISKRIDQAETGARYHLLHAVALLAIGATADSLPRRRRTTIVVLLVAGILLFSGSLYLLVLLNLPAMGAITPFGGAALILAWLLIASLAFGAKQQPRT